LVSIIHSSFFRCPEVNFLLPPLSLTYVPLSFVKGKSAGGENFSA
jgi:hypothetical protein